MWGRISLSWNSKGIWRRYPSNSTTFAREQRHLLCDDSDDVIKSESKLMVFVRYFESRFSSYLELLQIRKTKEFMKKFGYYTSTYTVRAEDTPAYGCQKC